MTKESKKPAPARKPADVPSTGSGSESALDALRRKRAPPPPADLDETRPPAKGKKRS